MKKEETVNLNSVADTTHIADTEFAGNVIIHSDCEVRGDLTVYGSLISIETVYEDRLVYKNVDIKELPFIERLKAIFKL